MSRQPPRLESERMPPPLPASWLQQIKARLEEKRLAHQRLEDVLVWLRYDLERLPPQSSYATDPDGWFDDWLACIDAAYLMRESPLTLILGPPERPAPFARMVSQNLRRYLSTRYVEAERFDEIECDFAAYLWERSPRWDPSRGDVATFIYQLVREFCSDYRRREGRHRWRFPRLLGFNTPVSPSPTESSELLEELRMRLELALRLTRQNGAETEGLLRLFARAGLPETQLDCLRPCQGQVAECPAALCLTPSEKYRSLSDKDLYALLGSCRNCPDRRPSPEALQRRVNYQANRLMRLLNAPPRSFPEIGIKGLRELLHDFFTRN